MRKTSKQQQQKPSGLRLNLSTGIRLLLLATLVSACGTSPTSKTDIRQRAQERWDAVMAGDYDTAYSYYSPGYRSANSRVDFEIALRVRRVRWTSAEVQESSCDADVCKVVTTVGYAVAGAVPGVPVWKNRKNIEERWVRTDGQWWFLPDDQ